MSFIEIRKPWIGFYLSYWFRCLSYVQSKAGYIDAGLWCAKRPSRVVWKWSVVWNSFFCVTNQLYYFFAKEWKKKKWTRVCFFFESTHGFCGLRGLPFVGMVAYSIIILSIPFYCTLPDQVFPLYIDCWANPNTTVLHKMPTRCSITSAIDHWLLSGFKVNLFCVKPSTSCWKCIFDLFLSPKAGIADREGVHTCVLLLAWLSAGKNKGAKWLLCFHWFELFGYMYCSYQYRVLKKSLLKAYDKAKQLSWQFSNENCFCGVILDFIYKICSCSISGKFSRNSFLVKM